MRKNRWHCFRPLIRGFFFYLPYTQYDLLKKKRGFPSPHSGILFLFPMCGNLCAGSDAEVSVPSFGDSFFIIIYKAYKIRFTIVFVSVPSFGDSFFMFEIAPFTISYFFVSVPSFGDSFFILGMRTLLSRMSFGVSVPSFGDSFFIRPAFSRDYSVTVEFPSPHSGILFLFNLCDNTEEGLLNSFRPLIRGFFFYPVVMICRQV